MSLEDPAAQAARPANPEPAPSRRRVRRSCPKVTPPKPPSYVSKKEAVGGRCNYIPPDGKLCPHWRARDSRACPCHVEAYEGRVVGEERPAESAPARKPRKKKPRVVVMMEPNTMWTERERF